MLEVSSSCKSSEPVRFTALVVLLGGGFFCSIVVGTLVHEMGHILAAHLLGYKTYLHYGSMSFVDLRFNQFGGLPFYHDLLVTLGGVLVTIVGGTLGFVILLRQKGKQLVNVKFWGLVYLSLFWSREVINLMMSNILFLLQRRDKPWGGDEYHLELLLGFPSGSICVSLAAIGGVVCAIVIFRMIPYPYRFKFLFSGCTFGVISYYVWFYQLGPLLLP